MKIGIIGSGDVGRRLADGLIDLGHQVKIGTRDITKKEVVEWIDKHTKQGRRSENALIGSFNEAAAFADDLIVISTSWSGTLSAIKMAGPSYFADKVVIDTTNPLDFSKGLPPRMAVGHADSGSRDNSTFNYQKPKLSRHLTLLVILIWFIQIFRMALLPCSYVEMMKNLKR